MSKKDEIKALVAASALPDADKEFWYSAIDSMVDIIVLQDQLMELFQNEKDPATLSQATEMLRKKLAYIRGENDISKITDIQKKLHTVENSRE
jgi:hypothetical protein